MTAPAPSGFLPVRGTWHNLLFTVSADELRALLGKVPVIVSGNSWVPVAEPRIPLDTYVDRYQRFLDGMIDPTVGCDPVKATFTLHARLSESADIYLPKPTPNPQFLYFDQREPVAEIDATGIVDTAGRLGFGLTSNDGGCLGLRLSYAKAVTFGSEEHEIIHETDGYAGFSLYRALESSAREMTQPCVFEHRGKTIRSRLRASKAARRFLRENRWLLDHGVILQGA